MSNSSLICYTNISPNRSSPRNHEIDTIAIHCMAGHLSLRRCGELFSDTNNERSANYGINDDGEIGLFVEERDRSWCTSSRAVDNRAVTIEVASDVDGDCWVTDKALQSTITLCADICKRNRIERLVWSDSKNDRVNHLHGCNMEVHRDHDTKACPGDYLMSKMQYIADEVNKLIADPDLVVDGLDYSKVYDYNFYINKWKDVKDAFKGDKTATFNHFLQYGMKEFRQAKEDFNPQVYYDNYDDLRKAYGNDRVKYYQHYIKWGKDLEHRNATYHIVPVTKLEGDPTDYALVYDAEYYIANNADVKKTFGDNYDAFLRHFIQYGMKEQRQAKSTFNEKIYRQNYPDLQKAYGSDFPKYYYHYINAGYKEGRVADRRLKSNTYTYKEGDTISKIASKYNLTVDKLLELNGIKFTPGQKLKVKS